RRERRGLLERLAGGVAPSSQRRMCSLAIGPTGGRSEDEPVECSPHHDLDRVGCLVHSAADGRPAKIPLWAERRRRADAVGRLRGAQTGALQKFAGLLASLASLFEVDCCERVHIFEEDGQTVAFNGFGLYFNLRFFVEERHEDSWPDAVAYWFLSFAHELAHFESPRHDRRHGRAMENAQRAGRTFTGDSRRAPGRRSRSPEQHGDLHQSTHARQVSRWPCRVHVSLRVHPASLCPTVLLTSLPQVSLSLSLSLLLVFPSPSFSFSMCRA
ncbi:unnamed protein product, partial [Prorocentrum cordatum]